MWFALVLICNFNDCSFYQEDAVPTPNYATSEECDARLSALTKKIDPELISKLVASGGSYEGRCLSLPGGVDAVPPEELYRRLKGAAPGDPA